QHIDLNSVLGLSVGECKRREHSVVSVVAYNNGKVFHLSVSRSPIVAPCGSRAQDCSVVEARWGDLRLRQYLRPRERLETSPYREQFLERVMSARALRARRQVAFMQPLNLQPPRRLPA